VKINVLDKKVYNRIAAGEVVERPFSVIKELVENSIDAGAKNISVSIWNGGKDRIEIEDDGCGIEREELYKAFMPHATSKISDVKDLDRIITLGFRGEALASIASVAKVTILSKPKEQEFGAKIYSEGGNTGEAEDAPSKDGTKITVDSLFFNTPVRAKFLKTTRAEEGDISDIVGRLILANPDISFKYYVDGKLSLQSYGGGLEEAVIAVYGANTVRNCFKIETVKNGIIIKGYIGRHNFTKANRTYQTLILNGRYVINSTVSAAVQNAYQAYLMKRQYPFFVLDVTVPVEEVDVNVHPNKTDVRFVNNQVIYGSLYSVVSKVLDGTNEALDIVKGVESPLFMPAEKKEPAVIAEESAVKQEAVTAKRMDFIPASVKEDKKRAEPVINYAGIRDEFYLNQNYLRDSGEKEELSPEREKKIIDVFAENKKFIEEMERKAAASSDEMKKAELKPAADKEKAASVSAEAKTDSVAAMQSAPVQSAVQMEKHFNYVGQALKTYLIFECDGDVYFIDQHAAHERLLFDSLYEKAMTGNAVRQPLLVPYVLNMNSIERGYFEDKIEYLEQLGFSIEEFGGDSYKITEVPLDMAEVNLETFFRSVVEDGSLKQEKVPEIIREKLCQRACKAAVKAGYDLSRGEIDALISRMKGDMGLKCPHGRPVAVRITGTEIEKWFKRIV